MSGLLDHSPADIIRRLLIQEGLGIDPVVGSKTAWQIYATSEPDDTAGPDSVITVYDTAGIDHGREMVLGTRIVYPGIQIRVRAAAHTAGFAKANAIAIKIDESVYWETVTIGGVSYRIQSLERTGDIQSLGREPNTKRRLWTINAVATLWKV